MAHGMLDLRGAWRACFVWHSAGIPYCGGAPVLWLGFHVAVERLCRSCGSWSVISPPWRWHARLTAILSPLSWRPLRRQCSGLQPVCFTAIPAILF
eukprot:364742-Chlamydomonas_euryale.AAC.4